MKKVWISVLVSGVLVAGCAKKETVESAPPAGAAASGSMSPIAEKTYPMAGKIVSRDSSKNQINLDGDKVEGVMDAMKMDYEVKDAKVDALPPDGTRVNATLHQQGDKYWLTKLQKAQ